MAYPTDRKYTKDHEWIRVSGDTADVGITDYAQRQLGDVVYVDLPDVGRHISAGESFGSIESVKAVSELFAPMSGEVVEVNPRLKDHPEAVNSEPHESWMVKVRLSEPGAGEPLLDAAAYEALVKE
ncbi:MAG TPA: glycine cleavage system protein GcvH [Vicinamibacterales bacterium]|jgi:glycine cleavage system H protein|nr:glycine cleavage system protein GcvH [Vicinamibacterales bacterium]